MAAAAHNPAFAKKVGIPTSVAKDFNKADKGKKFGTGGDVNYSYGGNNQINKQRTRFGSKFGYKLNAPDENLNKYAGLKEGGMAKKDMGSKSETRKEMAMDKKQDKAMIKKAVTMHDKQLHGGKKTNLSKLAKGGVPMATNKTDPRVARMLAARTAVAQDPSKARAAAPMFSKGGRTASKGEHPVQTKSKRGASIVKMCGGGMKGKK
jgi:hypothetical protein